MKREMSNSILATLRAYIRVWRDQRVVQDGSWLRRVSNTVAAAVRD
jgi:hypothetical protein